MGKLFGTDGVRGIANKELTCELAFKIGQATAYVLKNELNKKPCIVIGKDTRISGDMLEAALSAGLCSQGAIVTSMGIAPTPAVAYITKNKDFDAGIVISASHNEAIYNGIKIFNKKGYKLNDDTENKIEDIILNNITIDFPNGDKVGTINTDDRLVDCYTSYAISTCECNLKGLKIAVDCANGASYKTSIKVLSKLGADIYAVATNPDGININYNCGSTHTESFCNYVKNINADIGLSFDGDADRLLICDEMGNLIDGDKIMLICAKYFKKINKLKKNTLVTTILTNIGLVHKAKENGINIVSTKVGDRYVLEEMLKNGYSIGGEQSGHIIFLDYSTTGDGLISALQVLNIMKKENKKISELSNVFIPLPQVMINAKVKNENKNLYLENQTIKREMDKIDKEFKDNGRVLIRPSGTEPLIRVMIEGSSYDYIEQKAKYLAELIETELGE